MKKDYREKTVKGLLFDTTFGIKMHETPVTVRMTSDKVGQSLSLSAGNYMILIPMEQVRDIIKVSERSDA